jgi:F5/8 type C domain-containing protein
VSAGTGTLTLTATAASGVVITASSQLHFSADLALNPYGAAWPRAFASSSQSAFPPELAVDGNTQTLWVSGGPATAGSGPTPQNPAALGVDFGAPVTIGSVTMTPRSGYGPTNYSIQTSTDGQNWTTIATVTSAPNAAVTTAVPSTTAQWLRLLITGSHDGTDRNVQVAELTATAP